MYSEYTVHSHCGFPERFTIYFTSHIEAVERFTYCERLNAFKMPTASRDHLFLGCCKGFLFFLPTVFRLLLVTNAVIHCGYVLLHWQYGHMLDVYSETFGSSVVLETQQTVHVFYI